MLPSSSVLECPSVWLSIRGRKPTKHLPGHSNLTLLNFLSHELNQVLVWWLSVLNLLSKCSLPVTVSCRHTLWINERKGEIFWYFISIGPAHFKRRGYFTTVQDWQYWGVQEARMCLVSPPLNIILSKYHKYQSIVGQSVPAAYITPLEDHHWRSATDGGTSTGYFLHIIHFVLVTLRLASSLLHCTVKLQMIYVKLHWMNWTSLGSLYFRTFYFLF